MNVCFLQAGKFLLKCGKRKENVAELAGFVHFGNDIEITVERSCVMTIKCAHVFQMYRE